MSELKQQNRVQLSFFSIVKIFAIYGLALELFFILFYTILYLGGFGSPNLPLDSFLISIILFPFITMIFAVIGYPFFALFNRFRGGLLLTIVKVK